MKKTIGRALRAGGALLAAGWLAAPQASTDEVSAAPAPPSSREILREMGELLRGADQLSFHVELTFDEVMPDGQLLHFAGATDVAVRRPDRLFVDYRDDLSAKKLWYDGKTLTLYDAGHHVVASGPAAPRIDEAIDQFEREYGVFIPLASLVDNDPHANLLKRARRGTYVGLHDVEGTPCHHLAFRGDEIDWQVWVEAGDRPVPRKVVLNYKTVPGSPQYIAVLMDWSLAAKLPDSHFEARVPDDAIATTFLAVEEVRR